MQKYRLLRERLVADGFWKLEPSAPAPRQKPSSWRTTSHTSSNFVTGTLPPAAMRRIGFPWSEGLVKRTLASAGGTLAATNDAMDTGFGGTLAGGTHHAFRVGRLRILRLQRCRDRDLFPARDGRVRRAAVVDLDVHQGDGTAHFFEHDPDVLTISLHGANNFPFRKQRSKIDVELPDKTGDEEYLRALDSVLPRVAEFAPEIVFYLSGVDALATDVLGRLALSPEGLMARDRRVIAACRREQLPLVITLGGGYSKPIDLTAEAHANTFRVAADILSAES